MTKQEAIKTIKLALSQVEWDYPLDYAVAFDMAISAMEKQDVPDTNVGNMISRQDAIDAHCEFCEDRGRCNCDICPDVEVFQLLPSAQSEKRTENTRGAHACDCIDRQSTIDTLMTILDKPNHAEFLYTDEICKTLNKLPYAQLDIVRCKDCKYWHREIHNGIEYFNFSSCDLNHHGDGHDFYCADAERRTDE